MSNVIRFTIYDDDVKDICFPSDTTSSQHLMFWIKDNIPEAVVVGSVPYLKGTVISWRDDGNRCTHYQQSLEEV